MLSKQKGFYEKQNKTKTIIKEEHHRHTQKGHRENVLADYPAKPSGHPIWKNIKVCYTDFINN